MENTNENPTKRFIEKLELMSKAEQSILCNHSNLPINHSLNGFDIFTGLWWPLRQKYQNTPRRDVSWLIAKLYAKYPIKHAQKDFNSFAKLLGKNKPKENDWTKFKNHFDSILNSSLDNIEYHISWGLSILYIAAKKNKNITLNWVQLIDDLSIWDRGKEHRKKIQIQVEWAKQFLSINDSKII